MRRKVSRTISATERWQLAAKEALDTGHAKYESMCRARRNLTQAHTDDLELTVDDINVQNIVEFRRDFGILFTDLISDASAFHHDLPGFHAEVLKTEFNRAKRPQYLPMR